VGIERLIESLECCMWSSMIKKKVSGHPPITTNAINTSGIARVVGEKKLEEKEEVKEGRGEYVIPEYSREAINSEIKGVEEEEEGFNEEEAESMLKLMQEIKQLKEVNKNLSDEERRKNAEEMIMKLS